jgi:alcohol dehydrogenase-like protein
LGLALAQTDLLFVFFAARSFQQQTIFTGETVVIWIQENESNAYLSIWRCWTLKLEDIPRLMIADDQILVRVYDVGLNPIDWKIRQGYLKQVMPAHSPLTLGQDFAGGVTDSD